MCPGGSSGGSAANPTRRHRVTAYISITYSNTLSPETLVTTTTAPASQPAGSPHSPSDAAPTAVVSTASIVATMLQVSKQVSDLIFSPSRAPQVELNGQLKELNIAGVGKLTP